MVILHKAFVPAIKVFCIFINGSLAIETIFNKYL